MAGLKEGIGMITKIKLSLDMHHPLSGGKGSRFVTAYKQRGKGLAIHKNIDGDEIGITHIQTGMALRVYFDLCDCLKVYRDLVKCDNWIIKKAKFSQGHTTLDKRRVKRLQRIFNQCCF